MIYGKYGEYYDMIYSVKNYDAECDNMVDYFEKFSERKVRSVLDVGCGTGNHAILLARKGFKVVGIDSSKIMISQASKKAKEKGLPVGFHVRDMKNFNLERKFDAAICLFGTLGYCITDEELRAALSSIGSHLNSKGILVFDFWPVYAYSTRESWQSVREIVENEVSIIRIMNVSFDLQTSLVKLKVKCYVIRDKRLDDLFEEEHVVRAFVQPEMKHLLRENWFNSLGFFKVEWGAEKPYSFNKVDLKTTNVACMARKR